MGLVLSCFPSLMGSVLSSLCSPSLLPPPSSPPSAPPSPPPPPTPPQIKSEVFLSFRGKDTRDNFISHLHKALVNEKIVTFIDDNLNRGEEISPSLLKAIEESQIAIIIFSKDYASSRWCLNELVKILECRENHGQIVIPVFYKIEPSEVRNQTGSFEDAFAKHQNSKENSSQVQKWRDALQLAGSISGFDSLVVKPESALIEKIVQNVLEDLKSQNNVSPSVNKKLVGIETRIKEIEMHLGTRDQKHNDVRSVGIWGIGGIGKTTLAKAVCEKISCQFEGFHFCEGVREALVTKGPKCLRQELCSEILGDNNAYNYQLTKRMFSRMKLLIIFDDVTSSEQVDDVIGDFDCFGFGSRIIITSRDQQVLKNYGVDYIYEVKELSFDEALKLFCRHAFKQNCPEVGYMELSEGVIKNVGGVPLALKVLGSFLLDKRREVWESSMKKLENSLHNKIYEVLKISYDGLDLDQQRLFLDIACFFIGWDINLVIAIMDANDFCTDSELSALEDKCLIIKLRNTLMMHDLLQAMGKMIVQQESIDPGERTRLWNYNDICDVLTNATGTTKIEGISLDMSNIGDIHLHRKAFKKMHNLRFLRFWRYNNNKMHVPQDLQFRLNKLSYLQWEGCPLKSLQSNLHLKNLVKLELRYSNVEQLWSDAQQFDHLKKIELSFSKKLIRLPDLIAPKLEALSLYGCASLIEMPSSFQHLSRLVVLYLVSCENLTSVPQLPKSLDYVDLSGCSKLQRLPELPNNLDGLALRKCSSLIEIPSSIQYLTRLRVLDLDDCINLTSIPDYICPLSLQYLELVRCSKLKRLPEILDNFVAITLEGCTSLFEIPSSFKRLSKLKRLTLRGCESLTSIPDLMGLKSLTDLTIVNCSKLKVLPEFPDSIQFLHLVKIPIEELPPSCKHLCSLVKLALVDCSRLKSLLSIYCVWKSLKELSLQKSPIACSKSPVALFISRYEDEVAGSLLPPSIDVLHNLRTLNLSECGITEIPDSLCCLTSLQSLELDRNNFERIPESIINLSKLNYLNISYCERLKVLPKLPWASIDAVNCTSLEELSCPSFPNNFLARNVGANFVNCFKLDRNSLDNFLKDTQQEMLARSSSSYRRRNERKIAPLVICYPGSEILEWFDFQSTGSFVDVKLTLDRNMLCYAVCAVVSFPQQFDRHYAVVECDGYAKSKEGGHHWEFVIVIGYFDSADCSHVIVGFDLQFLNEPHDNEFTFKCNVSDGYKEICKVEKCGFHLISS